MSDEARDRLIIAEIAGAVAHHAPLSGPFPYGEETALAAVWSVARGRRDLLARYAGWHLGLSVTQPVDQLAAQLVAHASLAARAGADMDEVARWIPEGIARGEKARAGFDRTN